MAPLPNSTTVFSVLVSVVVGISRCVWMDPETLAVNTPVNVNRVNVIV